MKNTQLNIEKINSVVALHSFLALPSPSNPLISIIDHSQLSYKHPYENQKLNMDLYNITVKRNFKDQIKYGKNSYDYDKGSMSFIAPNQIIAMANQTDTSKNDGWSLVFHPDLIRKYPLFSAIKKYGFFSYEVFEGLHLSEEEEKTINALIQNIHNEIISRLDHFSQEVIVANLELLLSYCNRFYNRQFLTRKMATNDLLTKFETLLQSYFTENTTLELPKVEKIATELNVSSSYLSDMLRTVTGQNTQQHIHEKLIEKAKEMLTTTQLSVSEVAFSLGFEYSQSFSKLFKSKTNQTPIEFRNSFN
ncbi:helix-turn-helix domain-containing protein [Flavobacterium soli]|uniref:helix-turn-helix domain-containing protein n=1 Tax=Flavobacterium soli TaxID=344881 RepID=UPI000428A948|nr:helix-turn-helix transcriptional regulator [Flavobacterium soli]